MLIWVLADDRPGNYSQAIGLAESLSRITSANIEIKKINYNFLAKLPNFLKIDGLMGIDSESRNSLLNNNFLGQGLKMVSDLKPSIIISAGRKTAPINLFLKKYYQAVSIQIMNPDLNLIQFRKFDLVILPEHDKIIEQKNVVRIIGSLTRINEKLLDKEYQKFADELEKIHSPKIILLVGGSSKKGKFDPKIARDLGGVVSRIVNNMKANLLILNSRRTGENITEILDQNLLCSTPQVKIFFKWQPNNWSNPYFAALKTADFIIATGDSISMCSEISSLGKPVYIFNPSEICSKKHLRFHQNLFDQGFAKKLEQNSVELDNYQLKKLDETSRVAQLILETFLDNFLYKIQS